MDDLRNADFSARPEKDLTPAERDELKRRFDAFVAALKEQALRRQAKGRPAKKATVQKWQPPVAGPRRRS